MSVGRNQYRPTLKGHSSGETIAFDLPPDGIVVVARMIRYSVFCAHDKDRTDGLCCCAMWEHWHNYGDEDLTIGKIADMLKADGWKKRKKLWVCSECSRPKRKRRL